MCGREPLHGYYSECIIVSDNSDTGLFNLGHALDSNRQKVSPAL